MVIRTTLKFLSVGGVQQIPLKSVNRKKDKIKRKMLFLYFFITYYVSQFLEFIEAKDVTVIGYYRICGIMES